MSPIQPDLHRRSETHKTTLITPPMLLIPHRDDQPQLPQTSKTNQILSPSASGSLTSSEQDPVGRRKQSKTFSTSSDTLKQKIPLSTPLSSRIYRHSMDSNDTEFHLNEEQIKTLRLENKHTHLRDHQNTNLHHLHQPKTKWQQIIEGARRGSKRSKSRSEGNGSDDNKSATKRAKSDQTELYPWVIREAINPPNLSPILRQTQTMLKLYSRDPKQAKSSLLLSGSCPQFPDTEWTNLLAGRAVDLDHVLSGIHSITHEERRTERFRKFELIVGPSILAKTVKTHGEWIIAWNTHRPRSNDFRLPTSESRVARIQ